MDEEMDHGLSYMYDSYTSTVGQYGTYMYANCTSDLTSSILLSEWNAGTSQKRYVSQKGYGVSERVRPGLREGTGTCIKGPGSKLSAGGRGRDVDCTCVAPAFDLLLCTSNGRRVIGFPRIREFGSRRSLRHRCG